MSVPHESRRPGNPNPSRVIGLGGAKTQVILHCVSKGWELVPPRPADLASGETRTLVLIRCHFVKRTRGSRCNISHGERAFLPPTLSCLASVPNSRKARWKTLERKKANPQMPRLLSSAAEKPPLVESDHDAQFLSLFFHSQRNKQASFLGFQGLQGFPSSQIYLSRDAKLEIDIGEVR